MLECRTCVSRAIRAIAADGQYATPTLGRPLIFTPHLTNRPHRRRLATAAEEEAEAIAELGAEVPRYDALSALEPIEKPKVEFRSHQKGGPIVIPNEKALLKELSYLRDPLKLAEHVDYILRCSQPEKALSLCRLASKDMSCTVSWNHVLAWHMHNHQVGKAMDIYNEMKKRGQFPDTYTYMRLFMGFADNKEHIMKAVSIYHSMTSPTSRVRPGIMHTNAVLRMCTLAHNMDALWGIVSKLPEKGPNSADCKTYTIILQAIRHNAMGGDEADPSLMGRLRNDAVNEGRRIWQEIISKWRAGILEVDETLVVAMADLLLISRRMQDWDDVLELVQQTTNLQRLAAPLSERKTQHVRIEEEDEADAESQVPVVEDHDGFMPTPSSHAFKSVTPSTRDAGNRPKRDTYRSGLGWISPGNGILAVLVRACSMMRTPSTANAYWDVLTSAPYNVVPDLPNFHNLLRTLYTNRSSARANAVIQRMHSEFKLEAKPRTYAMAMSICTRDHKNRNIVDIATQIVDDMEKRLPYPNVQTLEGYLSLALVRSNGPDIILVLNRLQSHLEKAQHQTVRRPGPGHGNNYDGTMFDRGCVSRLIQNMIRATDVLIAHNLVPTHAVKHWQERRSELDANLSRIKFGLLDKRKVREQRSTPDEVTKFGGWKGARSRSDRRSEPVEEMGADWASSRSQRDGHDRRNKSSHAEYKPFGVRDEIAAKNNDGFADFPGELLA